MAPAAGPDQFPREIQNLAKMIRSAAHLLSSRGSLNGSVDILNSPPVVQLCGFTSDRRSSLLYGQDLVHIGPRTLTRVLGPKSSRSSVIAATILLCRGFDDVVADTDSLRAVANIVTAAHHRKSQNLLFMSLMTMSRSGLMACASAMSAILPDPDVRLPLTAILRLAAADGDTALELFTGASPQDDLSRCLIHSDRLGNILMHLESARLTSGVRDQASLQSWLSMVNNDVPLDWATDAIINQSL